MLHRPARLLALAAALLATSAFAQEPAPRATPSCGGGLRYDDGSFEGTVSVAGLSTLDAVMAVEIPAATPKLDQLCVCWTRRGGSPNVSFDLVYYRANGAGGGPGDLIGGLGGLTAPNVPLYPATAFYSFNVAPLGVTLPAGKVFLGASWDPTAQAQAYLCGDENGTHPRQTFYSADLGVSWADLGELYPNLDALGLRADLAAGTGGGGFTCVADERTLCLSGGRFQVRVDWRTGQGQTGQGRVVPGASNDSGLFWFFAADNWELLIKVLDACALNDRFWVFFAALTNVEFTLTVTDSQTGQSKQYVNPLNVTAPTTTDTTALPVCS
ncbi:MAG TPA: hypothetical protein VF017_21265 [Thermoanaerobaculia bacterium]|nr:hypothetical protein [Thermoanaerobaculia bacterium]